MHLQDMTDKILKLLLCFSCCQPCLLFAQDDIRSISCQPDFTPSPDGFDFLSGNNLQYSVPENTQISDIHITRLPIFDPGNPDENNWIYQLANRLHIQTKVDTIEQVLLFDSGENYDERSLQETGRLLRQQNYFQDATVQPVSVCGDDVEIEVVTRDTWSLTPGISFDRSGGENSYAFNIREANFLGRGKLLAVSREKSIDRDSNEFLYDDLNLLGTRNTLRFGLSDSNDGFSQFIDSGLPFYSLNSRHSWQFNLLNERLIDTLYFRGEEVNEVEHRLKAMFIQYGYSTGLRDGISRRYQFGYHYEDSSFADSGALPPPVVFPDDRKLSYPFVAYELIEDRYATGFNLNQIYRTEDLHLGRRLHHRLGFASEALGSDQDRLILEGSYRDTLHYSDNALWTHKLNWQAYWNIDTQSGENIKISYESRYFRRWSDRHSSFIRFEGTYTRKRNSNEQVTLGGLNGARAFDNRYQVGDRRMILNLEDRLYTNIHLFNLIRVGGAVFMDIGSAWSPYQENGSDNDILADAGFGLRFTASKGASRQVAHLDFAFPMTNIDDPVVDSFQIAFNVKSDF
ncbi:MAG: hypothetical protein CMP91_06865 [Gammaproteobacteria bacterium]|nr:hypothetical protein [Gammaproteobacteria bacterium]MAY01412.1 hypothetical protein [Gammaproteobacteria bacterium]|tara:strand:- start:11401 stop:13113 length:1713 start_codon:yes stop_codon:yes gene_type:complete